MQFKTPDGQVYQGDTYRDIVTQMSEEKFISPKSLETYMKATAKRTKKMFAGRDGFIPIDPSAPHTFILSMMANDLLIQDHSVDSEL